MVGLSWRDGFINTVLALQAWRPEFVPKNWVKQAESSGVSLPHQHWDGRNTVPEALGQLTKTSWQIAGWWEPSSQTPKCMVPNEWPLKLSSAHDRLISAKEENKPYHPRSIGENVSMTSSTLYLGVLF